MRVVILGTSSCRTRIFIVLVMLSKSIFLPLCLGLIISYGASQSTDERDTSASPVNPQNTGNSFVLVNPEQVYRLERTIGNLISGLAKPVGSITLRSGRDNLQRTICQICGAIRGTIMEFAKDSGLITSVGRSRQGLHNVAISDDWFSEALLQGSLLLRDLGAVSNEIENSMDFYSRKYNLPPFESKLSNDSSGVRFLGAVDDAADHGRKLFGCLQQAPSEQISNLNRQILDLAKRPPRAAVRTIKTNLNVSLDVSPKLSGGYKAVHIFICHSVKNEGLSREDCVRELLKLEECIKTNENPPESRIITGQSLPVRPWLSAIRRLSDCDIQREGEHARVSCKAMRDVPRNVRHRIRYIYETILNRRIRKRSALYRASNELGGVLSKSDWGRQLVDELCEYLAIYREGRRKLQKLDKVASVKKEAAARHKKISEALETYKRGLLLRTVRTIGRVHQSVSEFEKYLISGIKFALNETWQSHVRILSCLTDWMTKLFELYSGTGEDDAEAELTSTSPMPVSYENWYSRREAGYYKNNSPRDDSGLRKRSDVAREVDRSMRHLIRSMNSVSRLRTVNDKSTLACLANNLLLAAMFMETITFVSTLFCFGNKSHMNSAEVPDEWRNRNRRSFTLFSEEQNPDIFDRFRSPVDQPVNITTGISNDKSDDKDTEFEQFNYEQTLSIETQMNVTVNK